MCQEVNDGKRWVYLIATGAWIKEGIVEFEILHTERTLGELIATLGI